MHLPRVSNNAVHGRLRLAQRVNSFQLFFSLLMVTKWRFTELLNWHFNFSILFLFSHPLERVNAMFGLTI